MPGFNGTGPRGMGPMTGGGRGFCNPRGMRATPRPYGRFQGMGYGSQYYGASPEVPNAAPQMNREQELDSLKNQAQAIRSQLEQIESRIQQLGNEA